MSYTWKGVALPWGATLRSFIDPKDDEAILRSSIIWILLTRKGERVMLPTFGSDIPDTVFEPNDVALTAELSTSAREAIEVWDDRIEFISFSAEPDPDRNSLKLKIEWRFAQDPLEARTRVTSVEVTPALMGALL